MENPGNGALQLPPPRLGWAICCRWTRPQSATSLSPLWTAVEPHVVAACHTFPKPGRTLCGFWPLWQSEAPAHLPGSCLYHTVPFGQSAFFFSFPFWLTGSKAPKVGVSVWKFPWYNFPGCRWEAKWSWRGLCWKKSVINLHQVEVSVLMYYHSKCSSCGLRLPWLTKERRSSWGTALALSFPMSLALSWQE